MTRDTTATGSWSRRALLGVIGSGTVALAGCSSGGDGGDGNGTDGTAGKIPADYPSRLVLDGVALSSGFPVTLFDPETERELADVQYHPERSFQHWHQMPLEIPAGEETRIAVRVVNHNQKPVTLGSDGTLQVELEPTDETPNAFIDTSVSDGSIRLRPSEPGSGSYILRLVRKGSTWTSPPLDIRVTSG
jgi:hypothetical protein